jgi:hypothetical protein
MTLFFPPYSPTHSSALPTHTTVLGKPVFRSDGLMFVATEEPGGINFLIYAMTNAPHIKSAEAFTVIEGTVGYIPVPDVSALSTYYVHCYFL